MNAKYKLKIHEKNPQNKIRTFFIKSIYGLILKVYFQVYSIGIWRQKNIFYGILRHIFI